MGVLLLMLCGTLFLFGKELFMPTFAICQLNASSDPAENLKKIAACAGLAAGRAGLLLCPEYAMGFPDKGGPAVPGQPLDGPFVSGLCELARVHSLWIVCGVLEESGDPARPYNTAVVIDPTGALVRTHRKHHLFDRGSARESDKFTPGDKLFEPLDTGFGRIGLLVCYEVRFPEVARLQALAGAEYLLVLASFVSGPGKREAWHALLAARAIENGCYVLGADQVKPPVAVGESAAYGPDARCIDKLDGENEGIFFVDCDGETVRSYRAGFPSLQQRRTDLYRLEKA